MFFPIQNLSTFEINHIYSPQYRRFYFYFVYVFTQAFEFVLVSCFSSEWFENETGLHNPFDIDPATMREVAKFTEESGSIGLDRDGGMWTLARMITAQVNEAKESGGPVENILKLEAGKETIVENNVEGRVKRRRRHGGRKSSNGRR